MQNVRCHIYRVLLSAIVLLAVSCRGLIEHYDNPECDYTVRLRYDYNQENTTTDNRFDYYIRTLDEYIFDEQGILIIARQVLRDICDNTWHSDLDLPPGRYSVIAVGNRDARSGIWDDMNGNAPKPGVTRRDDMRMMLENAEVFVGGTSGPSEKLYHGYRTFTVNPTGQSSIRVDMVHSHLLLKLRVTWKSGQPAVRSNYHILLESVPSYYSLMPEYYYPKGSFSCMPHDPDTSDNYESSSNAVIHHIKNVRQDRNILTYRYNTYITNDSEMWGEFISYRLKNENPVRLHICHYDPETQTETRLLPDGINLKEYFDYRGINLNHTLKQDYQIAITIDGTRVSLMPLDVSDWEEGGAVH